MADDAPIIQDDDVTFIRDEENEDRMQAITFERALGANSDGEDSSKEDDEEFSAKCLNDSDEGLKLENFRDDDDEEVPLENSVDNSGKVYILSLLDALIDLYCTY